MKTHLLTQHPEVVHDYILEIDNSSLEYFNTCARSAEYQLVLRHGFAGSSATRYGGAIHNFLERRYKGTSFQENVSLMSLEFSSFPPMDVEEWRTLDHAITAMEQYDAFYKNDTRFYPEALPPDGKRLVEIPFRLPLTVIEVDATINYPKNLLVEGSEHDGPFKVGRIHVYWTGKMDALGWGAAANEDTNFPAVLDHKTTSMVGPTFFKDFELSQQVIGYVWAARRLPSVDPKFSERFLHTRDFYLDTIVGRKPTRTGVQNEFILQRYTYTDERIEEWHENVQHLIADFLSHLLRGFFPMQTKQCVGKYGVCPFHDVCVLPKDMRLTHLRAAFPRVTWSPLNTPSK